MKISPARTAELDQKVGAAGVNSQQLRERGSCSGLLQAAELLLQAAKLLPLRGLVVQRLRGCFVVIALLSVAVDG